MSNPYVRPVGGVTDLDGRPVKVGVDYDSVSIDAPRFFRLGADQAQEFARLYVTACWEAGQNKHRMDEEAADDAALMAGEG